MFLSGKMYEQAAEETENDMAGTTHASNTSKSALALVHHPSEAVIKRAPRQPQHHTSDRKPLKRPRTSLGEGEKVKIHEILGRRLTSSSRQAGNCKAPRCNEIWKGKKCFQNHYKKHLDDFANNNGTHTCCDEVFPTTDDILSHIWDEHMEGVGTFSLPTGLFSPQPDDAIPSPTAFSAVSTPRPMPIYPPRKILAPQHTPGALHSFASPPSFSPTSNHGPASMPMVQSPYVPRPSSHGHGQQVHAHGATTGPFDQIVASHNTSGYEPGVFPIPDSAPFCGPFELHGEIADDHTDDLAFHHPANNTGPYYTHPTADPEYPY